MEKPAIVHAVMTFLCLGLVAALLPFSCASNGQTEAVRPDRKAVIAARTPPVPAGPASTEPSPTAAPSPAPANPQPSASPEPSPASPEPLPSAAPADTPALSKLVLQSAQLGGWPDTPRVLISFRLVTDGPPGTEAPARVPLRLTWRADDAAEPLASINLSPGITERQATVDVPSGIQTGVSYRLCLESGTVVSKRVSIALPEPGLAERQSRLALARSVVPLVLEGGSWQETLPVPPTARAVWVELRDPAGKTAYRSARMEVPPADGTVWRDLSFSLDKPAGLSGTGPWQRVYSLAWPSGLVSSWQSSGTLTLGPVGTLQAIQPVNGETVVLNRPVFRWQELSGNPAGRLDFSAAGPDAPLFKESGLASREARNGQAVGDLREFLPGLKAGDRFWWRVRVPAAGSDGQELSSAWQSAVFRPVFDPAELAPVLPPGRKADFSMGSARGGADQVPVRTVRLDRGFALARYPMTNRQAAELANSLIQAGLAALIDGQVRELATNSTIIGLGVLDYGNQFGLEERPKGRLSPLPGRDNHPAIGVSWLGARLLARWLNRLSGLDDTYGYRLPSEAEWEYSASLGGQAASPWGQAVTGETANFLRSYDAFEDPLPPFTRKGGPTSPVGSFQANRLSAWRGYLRTHPELTGQFGADMGQLDFLGNCWDWCGDWYLFSGYDPADILNPTGPAELSEDVIRQVTVLGQMPSRVVRGGAWNSARAELTPQNRGKFPPDRTSHSIGFRLARSLPPAAP